jgi:hypothetical protein
VRAFPFTLQSSSGNNQYERDELTPSFALLETTLVIVREITPKITLDGCQEEEGKR